MAMESQAHVQQLVEMLRQGPRHAMAEPGGGQGLDLEKMLMTFPTWNLRSMGFHGFHGMQMEIIEHD